MNPIAARLSPATMMKFLHPEWEIAPHVRYMSRRIRDAVVRGRGRIIVTMPPGHIKSTTISEHMPIWMLEWHPERRVLLASYGQEKATEWGRKVRDAISEHADKLLLRLKEDTKSAGHWTTPEGGGMLCTGVGGAATGYRADLLIVDDPTKNAEEAASQTYRDRVWRWFQQVALTRLVPDGSVALIQTRWHQDDLVGRLISHQKAKARAGEPHDEWEIINFPCIAEEEDALGRKPGESLWPAGGYDEQWAELQKSQMLPGAWAALYQQRPSPEGGSIFKREHFRYFAEDEDFYALKRPKMDDKRVLKALCWIGQTADTAQKAKTTNDWTVNLTFAVTPDNDVLILDVARARLEVPDQLEFLLAQRARFPSARWQGVEDKASGIGLIQEAQRTGEPFKILTADVDKVARATPAAVRYQNGMVYHPPVADWLEAFESELLVFPNGAFDDQVDTLGYAVSETGDGRALATSSIAEDEVADRSWGYGIGRR